MPVTTKKYMPMSDDFSLYAHYLLLIGLLLAGCGVNHGDNPSSAASGFIDAPCDGDIDATANKTVQPAVSTAAAMNVLIVPLTINNQTALIPNTTAFKRILLQKYPLRGVSLSVRTPFTVSAADAGANVGGDAQWTEVIEALLALQTQENPTSYYYGMAPFLAPASKRRAGK